jgi:hypothetical protein
MRKSRGLDKGERELHLAIVGLELGAFRDLVNALAAKYPTQEVQGTGIVEAALSHLLVVVRLIERRCAKLRKRSRVLPPSVASRRKVGISPPE